MKMVIFSVHCIYLRAGVTSQRVRERNRGIVSPVTQHDAKRRYETLRCGTIGHR